MENCTSVCAGAWRVGLSRVYFFALVALSAVVLSRRAFAVLLPAGFGSFVFEPRVRVAICVDVGTISDETAQWEAICGPALRSQDSCRCSIVLLSDLRSDEITR